MTLLVVLPTFNERPNIERVAEAILRHPWARLLIVDDGSPDGTGAIADELAAKSNGRIEVMALDMTSGRMARAEIHRTGGLDDDAIAKETEWVRGLRIQ